MKCPRCKSPTKIRTSFDVSHETKRMWRECRNPACKYRCVSFQYYEAPLNQVSACVDRLPEGIVFTSHYKGMNSNDEM